MGADFLVTKAQGQTASVGEIPLLLFQQQITYACSLGSITEILNPASLEVTPVPNTDPGVHGLTNLRGEILIIVDFGYLLTHSRNSGVLPNQIIVLERMTSRQRETHRLGLLVESIVQVIYCLSEQIQPLRIGVDQPLKLTPRQLTFATTMCTLDDHRWPVLSPSAVMNANHW